jgi:DNA repair protein RadC
VFSDRLDKATMLTLANATWPPRGVALPLRAHEALTQTLKAALALVDVRVPGHLIVAGPEILSMAERGLL